MANISPQVNFSLWALAMAFASWRSCNIGWRNFNQATLWSKVLVSHFYLKFKNKIYNTLKYCFCKISFFRIGILCNCFDRKSERLWLEYYRKILQRWQIVQNIEEKKTTTNISFELLYILRKWFNSKTTFASFAMITPAIHRNNDAIEKSIHQNLSFTCTQPPCPPRPPRPCQC